MRFAEHLMRHMSMAGFLIDDQGDKVKIWQNDGTDDSALIDADYDMITMLVQQYKDDPQIMTKIADATIVGQGKWRRKKNKALLAYFVVKATSQYWRE